MKKTYIIPSVHISTLEANASILALSSLKTSDEQVNQALGTGNNMDDQEAKPWYRQ